MVLNFRFSSFSPQMTVFLKKKLTGWFIDTPIWITLVLIEHQRAAASRSHCFFPAGPNISLLWDLSIFSWWTTLKWHATNTYYSTLTQEYLPSDLFCFSLLCWPVLEQFESFCKLYGHFESYRTSGCWIRLRSVPFSQFDIHGSGWIQNDVSYTRVKVVSALHDCAL